MELRIDSFLKQDLYYQQHGLRVGFSCFNFSSFLGLEDNLDYCLAGLFHDIGKLYIPKEILYKPGQLDTYEFKVIKRHPVYSSLFVKKLNFKDNVIDTIRHHHESFDGSGYPDRLVEEQIPYGARILKIVDAFDALISDRPYRQAFSIEEALSIMENEKIIYDKNLLYKFKYYITELDKKSILLDKNSLNKVVDF